MTASQADPLGLADPLLATPGRAPPHRGRPSGTDPRPWTPPGAVKGGQGFGHNPPRGHWTAPAGQESPAWASRESPSGLPQGVPRSNPRPPAPVPPHHPPGYERLPAGLRGTIQGCPWPGGRVYPRQYRGRNSPEAHRRPACPIKPAPPLHLCAPLGARLRSPGLRPTSMARWCLCHRKTGLGSAQGAEGIGFRVAVKCHIACVSMERHHEHRSTARRH
jgi:hypothetical protein